MEKSAHPFSSCIFLNKHVYILDFVLLNIKMYEMMIMRRLISRITHDADEDFLTLLCR